jgi:hypothetical protein
MLLLRLDQGEREGELLAAFTLQQLRELKEVIIQLALARLRRAGGSAESLEKLRENRELTLLFRRVAYRIILDALEASKEHAAASGGGGGGGGTA